MISEEHATQILGHLRSLSIEERLKGITEAKELLKNFIKDGDTISQTSYSVYVLETCYNLSRDMLRVKQIRIKADTTAEPADSPSGARKTSAPKKLTDKVAKPAKPKLDIMSLMAEFAQMKKEEKT